MTSSLSPYYQIGTVRCLHFMPRALIADVEDDEVGPMTGVRAESSPNHGVNEVFDHWLVVQAIC